MRISAVFYLAGVLCALLATARGLPALPVWVAVAAIARFATDLRRGCLAVVAFAVGGLIGGNAIDNYLDARPTLAPGGALIQLRAAVVTFALPGASGWSFELDPAGPLRLAGRETAPGRLLVRGFPGQRPQPGDWCQLWLRLRPLHARANPGMPDRVRGYAARGIVATATVVSHPANLCMPVASRWSLPGIRRSISQAIDAAVPQRDAAAVLRAIVVGDRGGIDDAQRRVMRHTGTAHLLAISGLHVSLCAMFAFALARFGFAAACVRRQWRSTVPAAWIAASCAAVIYLFVSGAAIPALRATLMVACAALAVVRGRRVLSFDNLLAALVAVASLRPLSLLGEGCWLSFAAVALLILFARGQPGAPPILVAARAHLVLALGLAPLSALVFGLVTPAAPLANLVAVPWCAVFVVPLALAAAALQGFAPLPAALAWDTSARCWELLYLLLQRLADIPVALDLRGYVDGTQALILTGAVLMLLAPRALGLRGVALVVLVAPLSLGVARPSPGEIEVTVFDVGQGLSVLVRTHAHALLYDTGARWRLAAGSAALDTVIPGLAHAGVRQLDALVISHTDNDHAGGLADVLAQVPVAQLFAPPAAHAVAADRACRRGEGWRWDGVAFRWLHPAPGAAGSRNDSSCVLAVSSRHGSVLLSGDIEATSEARLVAALGTRLRAEVLVVPHHGSRTSSTPAFLAAVQPQVAIVSSGFGNRYGLPHAEIVERYARLGAQVVNTATSGAVRVFADRAGMRLSTVRGGGEHFWSVATGHGDASVLLSGPGRVW